MNYTEKKNLNEAFTLIELLVVIAIIGILSSVVLASLSSARETARDARRQQDINQLRTALEMYINDNGQAPTGGEDGTGWYQSNEVSWQTLQGDLSEYIDPLPKDPVNNRDTLPFVYSYRAGSSFGTSGDPCYFNPSDDAYTIHVSFESESASPDNMKLISDPNNRFCIVE